MALVAGQAAAWAKPANIPLYLEVVLNGHPTKLIAGFVQLHDGRIAIRRSELGELYIETPVQSAGKELIVLDDIPGLQYTYNASRQSIRISLPQAGLRRRVYDAGNGTGVVQAQTSTGAVLNYGLTGSVNTDTRFYDFSFSGISAHLDGRVFSSYGTLDASGIVGATPLEDVSVLRLNTTWSRSDPVTLQTWRAGDAISGGLAWTRPIRFGGIQLQKNFALRPDLVTLPLPGFSGSAAVPSTVDVYVNNIKSFSQDVPAGPFTVNNLPIISGAGTARVVIRDAGGRQTESTFPFFASHKQLRKGIYDYSLEAGFARRDYGFKSFAYDDVPIASGVLRYGLNNRLTLEGHFEGGARLVNAGMGIVTNLGKFGVLSLAGSASHFDGDTGGLVYAALDAEFFGLRVYTSTRRTIGSYNDLASVTDDYLSLDNSNNTAFLRDPPTAIDRISVSLPRFAEGINMNFGYVHTKYESEEESHILNASYSHQLTSTMSLFANGFYDFSDQEKLGIYAGISMSLGELGRASIGVSDNSSGTRMTANLVKSASHQPGSFGWRLRANEGRTSNRQASITYQGTKARVEGTLYQHEGSVSAQAYVDGAVVIAGGDIMLANRTDDAFAVVDVGAPDVQVLYQNRRIGKTDKNGKLLLPRLHSYQKNKITIDPRSLPVNADIPRTRAVVIPADRNGVVVDFNVRTVTTAAVVVLLSNNGKVIPAGSQGVHRSTGEAFFVGYDGRAYIKNLSAGNSVSVETPTGSCSATFPFKPQGDTQAIIKDVICR